MNVTIFEKLLPFPSHFSHHHHHRLPWMRRLAPAQHAVHPCALVCHNCGSDNVRATHCGPYAVYHGLLCEHAGEKKPRKATKKLTFCTPEKAQKVIDFLTEP